MFHHPRMMNSTIARLTTSEHSIEATENLLDSKYINISDAINLLSAKDVYMYSDDVDR